MKLYGAKETVKVNGIGAVYISPLRPPTTDYQRILCGWRFCVRASGFFWAARTMADMLRSFSLYPAFCYPLQGAG
jgi:hypothetical protein